MSRTTHPDFNKCKPEKRWSGGTLFTLWNVLNAELMLEETTSEPVYRILPSGALVALGRSDRLVVRIARSSKPTTAEGVAKFEQEVDTFARHFGIQNWDRRHVESARGIAMMLSEPRRPD